MQRRHIKLNCLKSCGLSEKLDNGMMERRYEVNWREGSEMSWAGVVLWGEGRRLYEYIRGREL